jgi:GAF domain-containing protein
MKNSDSKLISFIESREHQNKQTLVFADKNIKRFFALDAATYTEGVIDKKTKELMGLCASMVLRCDDCITYHIIEAHSEGATDDEFRETFSIALMVGGSIVIPHLRRAVEMIAELKYNNLEKRIKAHIDGYVESMDDATFKIELSDLLYMICKTLSMEVDYFDWVGFYLVSEKDTLVLGPYIGEPTDHTEIKFGVGVCGQVAQNQKIMIVPDVNAIDNYLSCSVSVKSELVIPIFDKNGKFVAQLDIDSHKVDPFTSEDVQLLESICEWMRECF